jgi:hypothetical protein
MMRNENGVLIGSEENMVNTCLSRLEEMDADDRTRTKNRKTQERKG